MADPFTLAAIVKIATVINAGATVYKACDAILGDPADKYIVPVTSYALSYTTASGESRLFTLPFNTRVLIGQNNQADLRPKDTSVASEHCSIRWVNNGVYVRHLRSHYKTSINDKRITEKNEAKWLHPGDSLRCGKIRFRLIVHKHYRYIY